MIDYSLVVRIAHKLYSSFSKKIPLYYEECDFIQDLYIAVVEWNPDENNPIEYSAIYTIGKHLLIGKTVRKSSKEIPISEINIELGFDLLDRYDISDEEYDETSDWNQEALERYLEASPVIKRSIRASVLQHMNAYPQCVIDFMVKADTIEGKDTSWALKYKPYSDTELEERLFNRKEQKKKIDTIRLHTQFKNVHTGEVLRFSALRNARRGKWTWTELQESSEWIQI